MGLEGKLPSGLLLTTVEKMGGYARKSSVWPAIFGLASPCSTSSGYGALGTSARRPCLAASIFLDILNVFLFFLQIFSREQ